MKFELEEIKNTAQERETEPTAGTESTEQTAGTEPEEYTGLDLKELENEIIEARENEEPLFFETFKNIRGVMFDICQEIREQAYDEAYKEYMESPEVKLKLSELEDDIKAFLAGETKQDPHEELRRKEIEAKAEIAGEKAGKEALPTQPLGIAIMLRKYIRFMRVKPEAKGQRSPLYYYHPDRGVWEEDNEFLQDIMAIITPKLTEAQAKDVLYKIARQSPMKPIAHDYTVIGDQLFDSVTGAFSQPTHKIAVTRRIDTRYNREAQEPTINGWKPTAWLLELFDGDQELYRLAIQIIRATLTGQSLRKIFWLYGEGGTGKGTFQQLLMNLVGMDNVASLKITGLEDSRFAKSILLGKSLVIGDDIQQDATIKDTSEMFSLVTGDIMTIEEKGLKPYSLRLNVTVVQSSNGLPIMKGDRSAIDRRFRILAFTKVFKDNPNKAIKDDYINRPEVLEYLAKLALETPTEDINPAKSQEILSEHHKEINPVIGFSSVFFTDGLVSYFLPNDFVYYCFKEYLEYNEINEYSTEMGFHKKLKQNLPEGVRVGVMNIPAGHQLPKGFSPREDRPFFAKKTYNSQRDRPEQREKGAKIRGYHIPKNKK
ncbi:DNA primase [Streptococcus mitis]|nr:DNA primase [Streptococcus sp. NLN76]